MKSDSPQIHDTVDAQSSLSSSSMTRRQFFRRTAAVGTVAVGVGAGARTVPRFSPIGQADALAPLVVAGAIAGAAIAGYVGAKVADHFSDNEDLTGYTGSDALHLRIEEKAKTLQLSQEQVLSTLENTVEFADNAALPKGMAAVVESFNAGKTQTEIQNDLEAAIDSEYYAGVETDILNAWEAARQQMQHWWESIAGHTAIDGDTSLSDHDVLAVDTKLNGTGEWNYGANEYVHGRATDSASHVVETHPVTLADGSTFDVSVTYTSSNQYHVYEFAPVPGVSSEGYTARAGVIPNSLRGEDIANIQSEVIPVLEPTRFHDLWTALTASRDRVLANLNTFVADVMATYEPGDIDLSKFVDPITAHTELASEGDQLAFAGVAANILGIPRNENPMVISLEDEGIQVEGSIYSTQEPDGGFPVGEWIDPSSFSYPVFMRYQYVSDGTNTTETNTTSTNTTTTETSTTDGETSTEVGFVQLQGRFRIDSAVDSEGNEQTTVNMEDGPTYDPADVQNLQAQLDQIHEEMLAMQEEAEANNSGGGGLFDFGSGGGGLGIALIAGALAFFGLSNRN